MRLTNKEGGDLHTTGFGPDQDILKYDVDGDQFVGIADLLPVVSCTGLTTTECQWVDFNDDGLIDIDDQILLFGFVGTACN